MTRPHLRIYVGPDANSSDTSYRGPMEIPLHDLVAALDDARDRTWLQDFADEAVEVSQDLYEVLTAFQAMAKKMPAEDAAGEGAQAKRA